MDPTNAEVVFTDRLAVNCIECGDEIVSYTQGEAVEFEQIELDIANADHEHEEDDPEEAADGGPG
jgi:hypothetical protein